jgi:ABC-2 type transport system permease protein
MRFGRAGESYLGFILPGVIGFSILVTSIRSGFSVVREMDSGFFRVFMAAPVSKGYLVIGKIVGGGTVAAIQGLVVLLLGIALGIRFPFEILPQALIAMFLLSIPFVALGLIIASLISGSEGLYVIANSLIMPVFFLSNSLYPLRALPDWLKILAKINPLTYGVDLLRIFSLDLTDFSIERDVSMLIGFALLLVAIEVKMFPKE